MHDYHLFLQFFFINIFLGLFYAKALEANCLIKQLMKQNQLFFWGCDLHFYKKVHEANGLIKQLIKQIHPHQ